MREVLGIRRVAVVDRHIGREQADPGEIHRRGDLDRQHAEVRVVEIDLDEVLLLSCSVLSISPMKPWGLSSASPPSCGRR